MDIDRDDLRAAALCGVGSAAVAVPVAYVFLDAYVAMTVSVMENPELFTTMFRAVMYAAAFASFVAGAVSAVVARRLR